ncbi:hypothetical protein LCGC14_1617450, partial [marine sediment metagenome]
NNTMYRRFLSDMYDMNERMKIIGLTATHYRLDSGLLTEGSGRLFTDVCYEKPVRELIDEGYLCNLISKGGATKYDLTGVRTRGGEFIPGELASAMNKNHLIETSIKEIREYGQDRDSWLIFCTGIQHAINVRDELRRQGIDAETLSSKTHKQERDLITDRFKRKEFQALTNCDILTTGFNAPLVDLIAMLRPTKSTGLYVQMVGRGMRPATEDCLILDFGGNIERHGPIDRINPQFTSAGKPKTNGEPPGKECPQCNSIIYSALRECPDCGYIFPEPEPSHDARATDANILSDEKGEWATVEHIDYHIHKKQGKPDSLKVSYYTEFIIYDEWVCVDHKGYAQTKARRWIKKRRAKGEINSLQSLLRTLHTLRHPSGVRVKEEGKFWRIIAYSFNKDKEPTTNAEDYIDVIHEQVQTETIPGIDEEFDFGANANECDPNPATEEFENLPF